LQYLYETHLHTNIASACAISNPEDYIRPYLKAGYSGIIVTDHFFNGNTTIPKNLPWKDKIELFYSSYERARIEGDKQGLSVFFGWKHCFENDEFLIYGLDKKWLIKNQDIMNLNRKELNQTVHSEGGAVVQAHPFRDRDYVKSIKLYPNDVDAVEVYNSGNIAMNDSYAYRYALKHNLPMTAGSNSHNIMDNKELFGVISPTKWESIDDYVKLLRSHFQLELRTSRKYLENEVLTKIEKPIFEF
jgi:hypothetical protein